MICRGVLRIAQPIVWIPFLTLMVVLNVTVSTAQTVVSDVSVDRKVEQISANEGSNLMLRKRHGASLSLAPGHGL